MVCYRCPNWIYTIFIELDSEWYMNFEMGMNKVQYHIYQIEECPKTGKKHMQGYVEFTEKVSMKFIKEIFGCSSMHLEPRKGSQGDAINYCKKEESRVNGPYVYGNKKRPGNRSDLDSIVDAIESNMTSKEILMMFRGNALRHMGMIKAGLESYHNWYHLDKIIEKDRHLEELYDLDGNKCPEVDGNTILHPPPQQGR